MSSDSSRILLVEDEPTLLTLYRLALSKLANITAVTTVEEAIQAIDTTVTAAVLPEVILLDLLIPTKLGDNVDFKQRNGFVVLKYIKGVAAFNDVPIFVMTNLDSSEDRATATAMGVTGYIVKSNVVPADIIQKIQPYLAS